MATACLEDPRILAWGVARSLWQSGISMGMGSRIWRWPIIALITSRSFLTPEMAPAHLGRPRTFPSGLARALWRSGISMEMGSLILRWRISIAILSPFCWEMASARLEQPRILPWGTARALLRLGISMGMWNLTLR